MSQDGKKDIICGLSNELFLSSLSKSVKIIIKQRKTFNVYLPSLWNKITIIFFISSLSGMKRKLKQYIW